MSTFSTVLDQLMKARDLSDEDLGSQLNVNRTTVTRWRSGIRNPKLDMLPAIAEILGVDPRIFIDSKNSDADGTKLLDIYTQLQSDRKQKVYDFATDQLKEQHESANSVQDNVKQLPHAETAKSTKADPFMPIAAHLDHELSDDERAEVDAWERKIAAEDDDDEDDDN